MDIDGESTLIVNVYFPADPKTKAYNQDEDLENVLASIENMIQIHGCKNVLITGDMNTDKRRKNGRVSRFTRFLSDNELESAWDGFEVDYTHEFEKEDTTYTSTLDYFIWNTELRKNVISSGVLHLVTNTSDHHPIYCDLEMMINSDKTDPCQKTTQKNPIIQSEGNG